MIQIGNLTLAPISEEYKKNEEITEEDIKQLKEWVKSQPHLPKVTDLELITFYHANRFNMDETKKAIDENFTLRTQYVEFFGNRIPDEKLQKEMDVAVMGFLPGLTEDGCAVVFGKLIDRNVSHFHWNELIKIMCMVIDLYIYKNGTCNGVIILLDMEGGTFGHFLRIPPSQLRKSIAFFRDTVNARRNCLYAVHPISYIEKILTLIRPFLNKDLFDMIHICKPDLSDVFAALPKSMIPKYLGGTGPDWPELHETMKADLIAHADFFREFDKRTVNESLRPPLPSATKWRFWN